MTGEMNKSAREWQTELSPECYRVLRQADTEPPWVGKYVHNHDAGTYRCAGCASVIFDADTKFESGSGWPSFYQAARADAVELVVDDKHGMARTEVRCRACGGHLGHLFDDGPEPTGQRYCMNSLALDFEAKP